LLQERRAAPVVVQGQPGARTADVAHQVRLLLGAGRSLRRRSLLRRGRHGWILSRSGALLGGREAQRVAHGGRAPLGLAEFDRLERLHDALLEVLALERGARLAHPRLAALPLDAQVDAEVPALARVLHPGEAAAERVEVRLDRAADGLLGDIVVGPAPD